MQMLLLCFESWICSYYLNLFEYCLIFVCAKSVLSHVFVGSCQVLNQIKLCETVLGETPN